MMSLKWSVGVTTTPSRREDLLPRTISSLRAGGFDDLRLFLDGGHELLSLYEPLGQPTTSRDPPVRPYLNWWLGLIEMYGRNPLADRYAMFQDDVVCSRNLRQYLEASASLYNYPGARVVRHSSSLEGEVPPIERAGYLNLYTASRNEAIIRGRKVGWVEGVELESGNTFHGKRQQKGLGALALVFSREAVIHLIGHPHMIAKPADSTNGHRSIDGAVAESMNRMGFREFIHNPSLVQHTGVKSTIRQTDWSVGAMSFHGEEFDCMNFLRSSEDNRH